MTVSQPQPNCLPLLLDKLFVPLINGMVSLPSRVLAFAHYRCARVYSKITAGTAHLPQQQLFVGPNGLKVRDDVIWPLVDVE